METILIFVASKEEADLLLLPEIEQLPNTYIIITGYGLGGTIYNMREFGHDTIAVNVGFTGVPNTMEIHKLYSVNTSILGPNVHNINRPKVLSTIDGLPQVPCITVTDFETDPERFYPNTCYTKDYLVDMELYAIANFFDTVYALKIPSDNGDMDEYDSQTKYKDKLSSIRYKIYDIVSNLRDE